MSARGDGIQELSLPDMERRVANMIRYGKIMAVDLPNKKVRVKSGEIESTWIRWPAGRAGAGKRRWDPPEVGEQVVMLAPTGDLSQATFIPGLYQNDHDAPTASADKDHVTYGDGTVIEYDRGSHTLTANLQSSTSIVASRTSIKATRGAGSVEVTNSAVTITLGGQVLELSAAGLKHNGKNIGDTHTHEGSPTAPAGPRSNTGMPN